MNKSFKIHCASCGIDVVRSNPVKTCSLKCRSILAKKRRLEISPERQCPVCGFIRSLIRTARGEKVCSDKCASTVQGRHFHGLRKLLPPRNDSFPCAHCGKPFSQQRPTNRFCSSSCKETARYFRVRKQSFSEKREERYKDMSPCGLCGITYEKIITPDRLGSNLHPQKFCWDHRIPRSHGGSDDASNKRSLCWFCNTARRDISFSHDSAVASAGKAFWSSLVVST